MMEPRAVMTMPTILNPRIFTAPALGLAAVLLTVTAAATASAQGVKMTSPSGAEVKPPVETAGPAVPAKIQALAWLAGCWQAPSERDGSSVREIWLAPSAGTMLGMGQVVRGDKSIDWEAMRLYEDGASVKLWSRPGARGEFTQTLERVADGYAAFAVTEGETTTRVSYQRKSGDEWSAAFRILRGENRQGADLSFKRVNCADWVAAPKSK